jgi:hypothetical protein
VFKEAARLHYSCNCLVGGGTRYTSGHLVGVGCVLNDRHLLTARHCWEEISYHYRWPVTLRHNGMFRCEVVFEDARRDIAVLRAVEKNSGNDMEPITRYPNLSNEELFLGAPVGFVSSLTLHDYADEATSHLHLAIGYVSMFLQDHANGTQQFALSTNVTQTGSAGSAVFLPSGDIIGVVVRTVALRAGCKDCQVPSYDLPVVAPILPLISDIRAVLAGRVRATV